VSFLANGGRQSAAVQIAAGEAVFEFMVTNFALNTGTEDTANWNKEIDAGVSQQGEANAVATDGEGNVYVAGYEPNLVDTASSWDWWVKKFAPDGTEDSNWNIQLDHAGRGDRPYGIAVDGNDNVWVVRQNDDSGEQNWWMVKFDSEGNVAKELDFAGEAKTEYAEDIAVDGDDNIYVVGYGENMASGTSGRDALIMKFDSEGNKEWERAYNSTADGVDRFFSVDVDSAGNVYAAGYYDSNMDDSSMWIKKLDSDGNEDDGWNKIINTYESQAYAVAVDGEDNVFVGGYGVDIEGTGTKEDLWLIKYSSDGTEQWDYSADGVGDNDSINALEVDSEGNVYIGAITFTGSGSTLTDWWIKKIGSNGIEDTAWDRTFDGPESSNDTLWDVVFDNNENLYAVGNVRATASASFDWWIKKFE
jgi:hypothetical protein